jgi:hypothetical protein
MRRLAVLLMTVPLALLGYGVTAASATVGNQHVSISTDLTGVGTITSTGAINDSGTFTITSLRQAGKGRTHHGTFTAALANGSYGGKFVTIQQSATLDPTTCTLVETGKGVDVINKHTGSGAYVGLKGTGHFTYTTTTVGTPTADGCDFSAPTGTNVIEGDGHVKLAS